MMQDMDALGTRQLGSLAHLACSLQVPLTIVEAAYLALRLSPALTLNGVVYVAGPGAERIASYIRKRRVSPATAGARTLGG